MENKQAVKRVGFGLMALAALAGGCSDKAQNTENSSPLPLVTGRNLASPATQPTLLPGMPMNLVASPDGKFAVICGMGYTNNLYVVATADAHGVDMMQFSNRPAAGGGFVGGEDTTAAQPAVRTNGLYYGLAIDDHGTVYAAQGANDSVAVLSVSATGTLAPVGIIDTRQGDFPAGIALDGHGRLYVANNRSVANDTQKRVPGSMAIYDTASRKELGRVEFTSPANTSNFPLGIAALADGSKAYVASERDGVIEVVNTSDPAHPAVAQSFSTGSHPVGVLLSRDQKRLFVANSQSDTISIIDTATDQPIGTVLLRPDTMRGLGGVTPTGLALSADQKTLYAALSDMNAIAVVDVASMTLKGMIPCGWYPSAVLPVGDDDLLVVTAKGHKLRNPNPGYKPYETPINREQYVLNEVKGDCTLLDIPDDAKDLAKATDQALWAAHIDRVGDQGPNPLAAIDLKSGKIKHVVYIIKENRTYDQVLGDVPSGNGDPSLALFDKTVTPNLHALAERFVLLDNCYACGEVSGDGWVWSTQSIVNNYVERNIPYNYSGRGRTFDTEGENNGYITGGFPANDPDGKPLSKDPAFKNGAPAVPDVGESAPHLWDLAKNAGVSYRNWGFFLAIASAGRGGAIPSMPDNYPASPGLQPPGHDLAGLSDIDFREFDLDFPDSDASKTYFDQTGDRNCLYRKTSYGKYNAPSRFTEWNREFQEMLAKDPTGHSVPNLMMVRFGHDHTQAVMAGRHSPSSEVADNDYACGQLVDAISHSAIWDSTAIFIIEDDAQNGPDHVDCHRTTAYVISPWIKPGSVDHHFTNTDSMLKTMELLLDLPPMSQYDAIAAPIADWDSAPSNAEPYSAVLPPKEIIAQINVRRTTTGPAAAMIDASDRMDFVHPDAAPANEVNEIIWKSIRGPDSAMPAPRHTLPSPMGPAKAKDDDDDD